MVLFYMQKKITALILIAGLGLFALYTSFQSDDIAEVKKSDVPDFAALSDVNAKNLPSFIIYSLRLIPLPPKYWLNGHYWLLGKPKPA